MHRPTVLLADDHPIVREHLVGSRLSLMFQR
jgi:hypothetical protein